MPGKTTKEQERSNTLEEDPRLHPPLQRLLVRFCQARIHPRTVTWERDLLGTDLRFPEAGSCKKDPP